MYFYTFVYLFTSIDIYIFLYLFVYTYLAIYILTYTYIYIYLFILLQLCTFIHKYSALHNISGPRNNCFSVASISPITFEKREREKKEGKYKQSAIVQIGKTTTKRVCSLALQFTLPPLDKIRVPRKSPTEPEKNKGIKKKEKEKKDKTVEIKTHETTP